MAQAFWNGPEATVSTVSEALDLGAGAVLFPSHPGGGISPTHPDYDPVWSILEDHDVPFMIHIGGEVEASSRRSMTTTDRSAISWEAVKTSAVRTTW